MVLQQQMGAIGDGTYQGMILSGFLVDTGKTCQKHNTPIYLRTRPADKQSEFCIACQQEKINDKKQSVDLKYEREAILANGYNVFYKESILSDEISKATLANFKVESEIDNKALNYAKRIVRDYSKGMVGNSILQGNAGVGKSHLSMGIAKDLNELFKAYNQQKSIVFVSVAMLARLIKDTFNYKDKESRYSQERMTKLLTECDYLILDDLGKESTTGNTIKQSSDWNYSFLFNILDNRESTIINTNFTTNQLIEIYDRAFVDRILKGARNNIFKFPDDAKSKRF